MVGTTGKPQLYTVLLAKIVEYIIRNRIRNKIC